MLSSLVCPGWFESCPKSPVCYFQHLYSWVTFKCWTSLKQISRFAWGGLTCSLSVLKQKRRNCHLDSRSWLNKLVERLTGPKRFSASHRRGKSLALLFLRGLLGFILACLILFAFLPQYPVGSSVLGAFCGAQGLGCHGVTHRGGNLVSLHLQFSLPSPLSQGETASAKWFPCLMRRGPKSLLFACCCFLKWQIMWPSFYVDLFTGIAAGFLLSCLILLNERCERWAHFTLGHLAVSFKCTIFLHLFIASKNKFELGARVCVRKRDRFERTPDAPEGIHWVPTEGHYIQWFTQGSSS